MLEPNERRTRYHLDSGGMTDALAQLFDHETDVPKNPTMALKHIGQVFADHMYWSGSSSPSFLANDLVRACNDMERNRLSFDFAHNVSLRDRLTQKDLDGWVLQQVAYLDNKRQPAPSSQVQYVYRSPVTRKRHPVWVTSCAGYESARLVINNHTFYWLHHEDFSAIINEAGTPSVHQDTRNQLKVVEAVQLRAANVTYVCYDVPKARGIIHQMYTTNLLNLFFIRQFAWHPDQTRSWPFERVQVWYCWQLHFGAAGDDILASPMHLGDMLHDLKRILEVQANGDSVITGLKMTGSAVTAKVRSRMVRIARKLLIVRAQAREERIAADPVKKCAACAIQAVKSQLALGIDPAPKRQRVTAA